MRPTEIEKRIHDTLESLEGIQRAQSRQSGIGSKTPIYESVMHRLHNTQAKVVRLSPRVALSAAACITVLITVNVLTCVQYNKHTASVNNTNTNENAIATEYFSSTQTYSF